MPQRVSSTFWPLKAPLLRIESTFTLCPKRQTASTERRPRTFLSSHVLERPRSPDPSVTKASSRRRKQASPARETTLNKAIKIMTFRHLQEPHTHLKASPHVLAFRVQHLHQSRGQPLRAPASYGALPHRRTPLLDSPLLCYVRPPRAGNSRSAQLPHTPSRMTRTNGDSRATTSTEASAEPAGE